MRVDLGIVKYRLYPRTWLDNDSFGVKMIELGISIELGPAGLREVRFIELRMRELEAEEILENPTNELEKAG